jgi:hypothetical protein
MGLHAHANQLTQDEVVETFVKVLSDTHGLKLFLLSELPNMTYKSNDGHLRMLLIHAGSSLNTQIFRLDTAMRQLKRDLLKGESLVEDGLDFTRYLLKNEDNASIYNDVKLLNHLMLIVGIEVNAFRLLSVLSKRLVPKHINQLMKLNLSDALEYQTKLLVTYNSYVKKRFS